MVITVILLAAPAGALAGVAAHGFASRWPRRRTPGIGRLPLATTGAVLAVALAVAGPEGSARPPGLLLAALLLAIVTVDLDLRLIPDVLTLPGTGLALLLAVAGGADAREACAWALAAAAVFAVPAGLAPGSVGWGDVKLAGLMGAALGADVALALAVGLGVGGLVAVGIVARHRSAARRQTVPFAPPLALGCAWALLLG